MKTKLLYCGVLLVLPLVMVVGCSSSGDEDTNSGDSDNQSKKQKDPLPKTARKNCRENGRAWFLFRMK